MASAAAAEADGQQQGSGAAVTSNSDGGPAGQQRGAAPGGWQPTVLGIDKRDLLRREVLLSPAPNLLQL